MNARATRLVTAYAADRNRLLTPTRPETHVDVREELAAVKALSPARQRAHVAVLEEEIAAFIAGMRDSPGRTIQAVRADGEARAARRAAGRPHPSMPEKARHRATGGEKRRRRSRAFIEARQARDAYEAGMRQAHHRCAKPMPPREESTG